MRTLTIGNKDYTIEFSIEASLYKDCTEKITGLMASVAMAQSNADIKELISAMSDVPQTALHMLHAGLLEHQENWDLSKTKAVARQYLLDRRGQEDGNYYALMEILLEDMGNDGFFELIGLDKMFQTEEPQEKQPKMPQDHKKKSNTKVIER